MPAGASATVDAVLARDEEQAHVDEIENLLEAAHPELKEHGAACRRRVCHA